MAYPYGPPPPDQTNIYVGIIIICVIAIVYLLTKKPEPVDPIDCKQVACKPVECTQPANDMAGCWIIENAHTVNIVCINSVWFMQTFFNRMVTTSVLTMVSPNVLTLSEHNKKTKITYDPKMDKLTMVEESNPTPGYARRLSVQDTKTFNYFP